MIKIEIKKMEGLELVKMSAKGQLVVPQMIRETEKFVSGERFLALPVEGGVFFKRVEISPIKLKFKNLSQEVEKKFQKQKVTKKDLEKAVKWSRKKV